MRTKFEYKHYLLILLTVVAAFNYLDRLVLSLLLEPIKQEFDLSDSQLGFLTGFGFALFYAVAGIPIARWADHGNRNTVVVLTTGLWSAMVALCGMVGSFTQLLLVRVGVAVGEAGCLPTASSLIADYFDRAERPKAMAFYWFCAPLAMILGYMGGGWLADNYGWRTTFIVVGVPGIFFALLAKLTLREPRSKRDQQQVPTQPPLKFLLVMLSQQKTLRSIVSAFVIAYFFSMGFSQWLPTFFMRSHGMSASEVGTWFALTYGGLGFLGTWLGGFLAIRYAACKESIQMRGCTLIFGVSGLLYLGVFLSPNQYMAVGCLSAVAMISFMCNGVIFSAIQSLVPDSMRAVTLAFIFLLANLVGLGIGPLAVGALSDLFEPSYAQDSLRYAMAVFAPGVAWVGYFYWRASKTIEADIQAVELQSMTAVSDKSEPQLAKDLV